jgi:hypothetical protein
MAALHGAAGAASHFLSSYQAGATQKDGNNCNGEKSVRSHHFVSSLGKRALGKRWRRAFVPESFALPPETTCRRRFI